MSFDFSFYIQQAFIIHWLRLKYRKRKRRKRTTKKRTVLFVNYITQPLRMKFRLTADEEEEASFDRHRNISVSSASSAGSTLKRQNTFMSNAVSQVLITFVPKLIDIISLGLRLGRGRFLAGS